MQVTDAPSFAPVTLGKVLATAEYGGFIFTDTVHGPNTRLPPHLHENSAVSMATSGSFRQYFGRGELACVPGSVLIEPGEREHSTCYAGDRATRTFIIEIQARPALLDASRRQTSSGYRLTGSPQTVRTMRRLAEEFSAGPPFDEEYLRCLALDIASEIAVGETKTDQTTSSVLLDHLKQNYKTSLRLETLANNVGRHPTHLCRSFRQSYGITIGDQIRVLRIRAAMSDLKRSNEPLADIALRAGFADQSHFGRVFLRYTGLTPGAYRRLAGRR